MPNKLLTFGCSSYRSGAKLVGGIQMTFGGAAILLMVHFGIMGRLYSPEGIPDHFWKFSIPTAGISVCSMTLSLLLLDGIYNKSIFQTRIWLAIMMAFMMVSLFAVSVAFETEEVFPVELLGMLVLGLVLLIYMFMVVASYHKVLKDELANVRQQLPKLNNVSSNSHCPNAPNDNSVSCSGGGGISTATNANLNNHSNLIIALTTGIDDYESRSRVYTIGT